MEAVRDFLKGLVVEEEEAPAPKPARPTSCKVTLHVYDFLEQGLNGMLRQVGTGGFHCGVEVHGKEWSFRRTLLGTGIYWYPPKSCTAHKYRESVSMGKVNYSEDQFLQLIHKLKKEWPGSGYDILRRNCCIFSNELCQKLNLGPIPDWITNLAGVGADLRSVVRRPLQRIEDVVFGEDTSQSQPDMERRHSSKPQPSSSQPGRSSQSPPQAQGRSSTSGRPSSGRPSRRDGYEKIEQGPRKGALATYGPVAVLVVLFLGLCVLAGAAGAGRLPQPAWPWAQGNQQKRLPMAPLAAVVEPPPRFDCDRGFDTWVVSWSLKQSQWCCSTRGRGCADTNVLGFDCKEASGGKSFEDWSLYQLDWCCVHKQVGCGKLSTLLDGRSGRSSESPRRGNASSSARPRHPRHGSAGNASAVGTRNASADAGPGRPRSDRAPSAAYSGTKADALATSAQRQPTSVDSVAQESPEAALEPLPMPDSSAPAAPVTTAPDTPSVEPMVDAGKSAFEIDDGQALHAEEDAQQSERLAKHDLIVAGEDVAVDGTAEGSGADSPSSGSAKNSGSAPGEPVAESTTL